MQLFHHIYYNHEDKHSQHMPGEVKVGSIITCTDKCCMYEPCALYHGEHDHGEGGDGGVGDDHENNTDQAAEN